MKAAYFLLFCLIVSMTRVMGDVTHGHGNLSVLRLLSAPSGSLLYNGSAVGVSITDSASLRSLLSDESGTGAALFDGGAMTSGTINGVVIGGGGAAAVTATTVTGTTLKAWLSSGSGVFSSLTTNGGSNGMKLDSNGGTCLGYLTGTNTLTLGAWGSGGANFIVKAPSGGSGNTNRAGTVLALMPGESTGSGTGYGVDIYTGTSGASGTTENVSVLGLSVRAAGVTIGPTGGAIPAIFRATATLDFGSTAAGAEADLTITCTGAEVGDDVSLGIANASAVASMVFTAWVSAADTVTVRYHNAELVTARDPASGVFGVTVINR